MTQNRYALSDADMLGITEAIDNAGNHDLLVKSVKAVWNAVLAQEGLSWDDMEGIVPGNYAIPSDQMTEIGERFKKRAFALGFDSITVTDLMMELIVQYGPSTYDNEPTIKAEFVFGTVDILPPPVFTVDDAEYAKRLAEGDGYYDK